MNLYYSLYERMVAIPLTVEVNPETIGDIDIFYSLTHYRWVFK
jgi:hypothetical protein